MVSAGGALWGACLAPAVRSKAGGAPTVCVLDGATGSVDLSIGHTLAASPMLTNICNTCGVPLVASPILASVCDACGWSAAGSIMVSFGICFKCSESELEKFIKSSIDHNKFILFSNKIYIHSFLES